MRLSTLVQQIRQAALGSGDLLKSLFALAKHNKGFWKSEKQGLFLMRALTAETAWRREDREADHLARDVKDKAIGQTVAFSIVTSAGYGKVDPTKIRMVGWVFVLDEGGVVAIAKARVQHQSGSARVDDWQIIPNTATKTFERGANDKPPFVVDHFGARRREQEATEKRKLANQPLINKLKGAPRYETNSFLQDMVRILESGDELSPRMKLALEPYLDEPLDLNLGSPADWKRDLEAIQKAVRTVIAPALAETYLEHEQAFQKEYEKAQEEGKSWGWRTPEPERDWAKEAAEWAANVTQGDIATTWWNDDMVLVLEKFWAKRWGGINLSGYWVSEFFKQVTKAIKRGNPTKLTKKAVGYVAALKPLAEKLSHLTRDQVAAVMRQKFKRP